MYAWCSCVDEHALLPCPRRLCAGRHARRGRVPHPLRQPGRGSATAAAATAGAVAAKTLSARARAPWHALQRHVPRRWRSRRRRLQRYGRGIIPLRPEHQDVRAVRCEGREVQDGQVYSTRLCPGRSFVYVGKGTPQHPEHDFFEERVDPQDLCEGKCVK